ncbi:11442_t:CDS:2 [Ambispora gerdemannii]|uniref:11442_t:CDS:1 n=1 Tax=Ambispora gerdemannii TaxID=144530 RepID=A0A9N8V6I2_9GLOM|nr:11442_t:CDS:2 [Ambispora gerdemannii]
MSAWRGTCIVKISGGHVLRPAISVVSGRFYCRLSGGGVPNHTLKLRLNDFVVQGNSSDYLKCTIKIFSLEAYQERSCASSDRQGRKAIPWIAGPQLEKRTGKYGTPRLEYLQELVNEYQTTTDIEAKHQILANLANFAYDPINYKFLCQLNVVDLFLDAITEPEEKIKEFENRAKEHIITSDGLPLIIDCLSSENENTVLSALATLMFLNISFSKSDIKSVFERVKQLSQTDNRKISNLAIVFLQDYLETDLVKESERNHNL